MRTEDCARHSLCATRRRHARVGILAPARAIDALHPVEPWSNVASQFASRFSITAAWTASRADSPGVDSRIRFARSVSASVTLNTLTTSPTKRSYTRSARSALPDAVYR